MKNRPGGLRTPSSPHLRAFAEMFFFSTPTSDTYCGTGPFSEPESQVASKFYDAHKPYVGAIDYHR